MSTPERLKLAAILAAVEALCGGPTSDGHQPYAVQIDDDVIFAVDLDALRAALRGPAVSMLREEAEWPPVDAVQRLAKRIARYDIADTAHFLTARNYLLCAFPKDVIAEAEERGRRAASQITEEKVKRAAVAIAHYGRTPLMNREVTALDHELAEAALKAALEGQP